MLSYIVDLRRISPLIFHTARTLSGSLCSPPSPRGEGFVSGTPLSPSNLRPFGAPPSIGRRECPREPLPLEGAAERSEAGLASFFAAKPPPLCLPHAGHRYCFPHISCIRFEDMGIAISSYRSLPPYRNSIPIRTIKPPCGATCIAPQGGLYISTGEIPRDSAGSKGAPADTDIG